MTKILTKTVTKQRERLKTLSAVMLHWAENNKRALLRDEYKVPKIWKKAFKYVIGLDDEFKHLPSSSHILHLNSIRLIL